MAIDIYDISQKCIHCFHSIDLYVKYIGKYPTLTYRSSICQDLDKCYPVIFGSSSLAIPAISPASQLIPVELPSSSVLVPIKALDHKNCSGTRWRTASDVRKATSCGGNYGSISLGGKKRWRWDGICRQKVEAGPETLNERAGTKFVQSRNLPNERRWDIFRPLIS